MNAISIISVCIAFLSLVFSTIWNIISAKKAREKQYNDIIEVIKKESLEQGETKILFKEMNKNLERIVEDNKLMNERIFNLAERVTLLEHDQHNMSIMTNQIPDLDNKANKAHQRIDIIEHDLKLNNK